MNFSLSITPGIDPASRHQLEDRVDAVLQKYGGETTGGGTMLDGSASDLDFECENIRFVDELKEYLVNHANIEANITLKNLDSAEALFSIECKRSKPWWQFW